jgi:hypothetical protein
VQGTDDARRVTTRAEDIEMLRVTIEICPGGQEGARREIATGTIARIRDGAFADYEIKLEETLIGDVGMRATVTGYPRWAGSVWDLVARCIAASLNGGTEALPCRPNPPDAPVHERDGIRYVCLQDIPEPTRTFFACSIATTSRPFAGCAFAGDWTDFLKGDR